MPSNKKTNTLFIFELLLNPNASNPGINDQTDKTNVLQLLGRFE